VKTMSEGRREEVNIAGALKEAAEVLRAAGVEEARREAALLFGDVSGRDRAYLFAHDDEGVADETLARFRRAVARRAAGEPAQYVTGRQEFYGLEFEVTPDVLIPRPETELLVETALELLKNDDAPVFCDVGTGSGCVAVALLHERRDARAVALDISPGALRVAARNAARHGVADRLTLLRSDVFDALRPNANDAHTHDAHTHDAPARFRMIVSNPPYIPERDIDGLQREVRDHEPRAALTPGGDGLAVIRRLVNEGADFLTPGGHLLFEIGYDQHEAVAELIDPRVWTRPDTRRDLQGIPRTVVLRRVG
jgi:protein-(glutamine-N5) methyltransferase, release factor-specific